MVLELKNGGEIMKLKIIPAILLSAVISVGGLCNNVSAENFVCINDDVVTAKVLQIIDGDAIKVQLLGSGEIALVKLLGVNAQGYNMAVSYLTDKILGANVTLNSDKNIATSQGNWNYMYVNCNGVTINDDIVMKGFAVVDKSHAEASRYSSMSTAERTAVANGSEIWNNASTVNDGSGTLRSGIDYTGDMVNINTATVEQLRTRLVGISNSVAEKIDEYRRKNPFNDIRELKFVEGITADIYTYNKKIICVSTNINKATREELETLGNISTKDVDDIISFRKRERFNKTKDLVSKGLMTNSKYNSISDFISESDSWEDEDISIPNTTLNVNTANQSSMNLSALGNISGNVVTNQRVNGYTFKSLQELLFIPNIDVTEKELNFMEDNIHTMTNINEASDSELRSIFTRTGINRIRDARWINNLETIKAMLDSEVITNVNHLEDIMYTSYYRTSYVNLNTATIVQMIEAGVPKADAQAIAVAVPIRKPSDLPVNVSYYNGKVALYTNINVATDSELKTLGLSDTLIAEINNFVDEQPFGSIAEVKQFFAKNNATSVYQRIGDFIVVR